MDIKFRKITDFPRGTLAALLRDGYSFDPKFERDGTRNGRSLTISFTTILTLPTSADL